MKPVVEVQDLTKRFGSFTAVNRINFSVSRGEIFGFLGANGAGKSTTIRILCGIQPPTEGVAYVMGLDIAKQARKIKEKIGYMSQKFTLYPDLTVLENIQFFGGIHKLKGKHLREQTEKILAMAELEGKENRITSDLPGGWKQKLALGCSVIHSPEILFLDEPTAGVDPAARRIFWNIIQELRDGGTTIFVTSHYMDEVEQCDRVALMHRGDIAALDSPSRLKSDIIPGPVIEISGNFNGNTRKILEAPGHFERIDPYGRGFHAIGKKGLSATTLISRTRVDLQAEGYSILEVKQVNPGLEDVFVYLIGNLEEHHAAKN